MSCTLSLKREYIEEYSRYLVFLEQVIITGWGPIRGMVIKYHDSPMSKLCEILLLGPVVRGIDLARRLRWIVS